MHSTIQRILDTRVIPPNWVVGLINFVPKVTAGPQLEQLRPIALQNVILKWFSNILFLMLEPCIDYLLPLSQKGSIRCRKIFEHIWDTMGGWFHMEHGAFLSVDFSKAYDTIRFNFCFAIFQVLGILQSFKSCKSFLHCCKDHANALSMHKLYMRSCMCLSQELDRVICSQLFCLCLWWPHCCMIYSSTAPVQC